MPVHVNVMYPKGVKFNMDYYLSTHMPLAQKIWEGDGLKGWEVYSYGDDAPYAVIAILKFDSIEDFQKTTSGPGTKEVFDDVPNFSDKKPEVIAGTQVGAWP